VSTVGRVVDLLRPVLLAVSRAGRVLGIHANVTGFAPRQKQAPAFRHVVCAKAMEILGCLHSRSLMGGIGKADWVVGQPAARQHG
jgi:hypothetical protein